MKYDASWQLTVHVKKKKKQTMKSKELLVAQLIVSKQKSGEGYQKNKK